MVDGTTYSGTPQFIQLGEGVDAFLWTDKVRWELKEVS